MRPLVFLYILLNFTFLQAQQMKSSVDSTAIKIGSEFKLTLKTYTPTDIPVIFPEPKQIGAFEVIESYPTDTIVEDGITQMIKKYGLTVFDSGKYTLPRIAVRIAGKNQLSDSFAVQVFDVEVDTLKQPLYEIKDIINTAEKPASPWWWLFVFLLLALAAAFIGFIVITRYQKNKNEREALLFASPIEKALVYLKKLTNNTFVEQDETKTFYSELTDISRTYLEESIEIKALESTSSELFDILSKTLKKKKIKLNRETLLQFKKVLATADLVKFAKSKPEEHQIENDKKTISNFLITLDKSIPRTEEEVENLFIEERKRKKAKRQFWQKIAVPVAASIAVFSIAFAALWVFKGNNYIRENFIGQSTASLVDAPWVTSNYGLPSIKIDTPYALSRINTNKQNTAPQIESESDFQLGKPGDAYTVFLATISLKDSLSLSNEQLIELNLKQLESMGAVNIFPKMESFDTGTTIKGERAFGSFSLKANKQNNEKIGFEILVFSQPKGIQQLIILYQEENENAKKIAERITQSIELETKE